MAPKNLGHLSAPVQELSLPRRTLRIGAKLNGPGEDDDEDPAAMLRVGLINGVVPKLLLVEDDAA